MACRGVHFALSAEDERRLLEAAGDDDAVIEVLHEEIEETCDDEWMQATDKAWDAIHRCLTDGTLSFEPASPLHRCVLGGRQLHDGDDYIITYVSREEVRAVADAIEPFDETALRARYDRIDEDDYEVPLSDEDFDYTWAWFEELRRFYRRAADGNRPVVFSVDQ